MLRRALKPLSLLAAAAVTLGHGACRGSAAEPPAPAPPAAPVWGVEIVAEYPHEPGSFTQGLLFHGGRLYESTGLYGQSEVREVELATGRVLRRAGLAPDEFGEGLARVGDRLVQLTWMEGRAPVWDLATLRRKGEHRYRGEGWGLAFDGERLIQSDGSDRLVFRDPESFAPLGSLRVTDGGRPVSALNELEWVEGRLYANLWMADEIAVIDPETGRLVARIDASALLPPAERARVDVLNGIAHDPESGLFLLTGKLWESLFAVRWVRPQEGQ
ncbi:MAG: glutaminyl-peptide cyclotransferase [Thermoanaerobaculia bacterium]|nr:glutaminyl-peptide cyclotransferase [Thermoanaerobaculia bacterium]